MPDKQTISTDTGRTLMLLSCPRCHNPRADAFPSEDTLRRYLYDNRNNRVCREENGQCVLMIGILEER